VAALCECPSAPNFSIALGLACYVLSLALTYRIALLLVPSRGTAILATFLLVIHRGLPSHLRFRRAHAARPVGRTRSAS